MVVSAVLKQPDPLPTAHANDLCHSHSKSFIFSLATSMTVSETRSLWCSSTLKNGPGCGPQASPPDQPSVQTASGYVRQLHSTNLGAAGQFSLPPKGLEEGCCTCNGCTYPLKPGVGVVKKGLSSNRSCLDGLAGGNRGGPSTRRSQHTSTLSLGVWLRVGVARVVRAQSASQVSHPSSEKSCNLFETQVECNTRCR